MLLQPLPGHYLLIFLCFTGLYPFRVYPESDENISISFKDLFPEVIAFPEVLKKDDYKCYSISTNPVLNSSYNLFKNFDNFFETFRREKGVKGILKKGIYKFKRDILHTEDFGAKQSLKIIKSILKQKKFPFFIFLNLMESHHPYSPLIRYYKCVKKEFKNSFDIWKTTRKTYDVTKFYLKPSKEMEEFISKIKILYDATILYLDNWLAQLWQMLERTKLLKNTIIIITSDHGENFGEKGYFGHKYMLDDSLIKIPLIFYNIDRKGIISDLSQIADIFPTIMKKLNMDLNFPYRIDGIDLFSNFSREHIFAEDFPQLLSTKIKKRFDKNTINKMFFKRLLCIRSLKYKLIWYKTYNKYYLYNMINDPEEKENVVEKEKDIYLSLKKILIKEFEKKRLIFENLSELEMDKEIIKRLKERGYF